MSKSKPPGSRLFATLAFQPLTIAVIDFGTTRVGLGHDDLELKGTDLFQCSTEN